MSAKLDKIYGIIDELESVVIGLSGGVDSTLISKLCLDRLGFDKVWLITGDSASIPPDELKQCREIVKWLQVPDHHFIVLKTEELDDPNYTSNPENRCYYCKSELFGKLKEYAESRGINAIVDGSNYSDLDDYRPGMRAAGELQIRSPFAEAKFTKDDIRNLAQQLGLPNWDKPAMPCLSSRIPYNMQVTPEKLKAIGEAEKYIRSLGFTNLRVRHHGAIARIELDEPLKVFQDDIKEKINTKLRELGFTYVAIDLNGFKSGSLNVELSRENKNV